MSSKYYLLFFILLGFGFQSHSQSTEPRGCAIEHLYTQELHSVLKPGSAEFESWMQKVAAWESDKAIQDNDEIYYIPVVIHVLHFGEAVGTGRNLSQARAQSQIDIMNNDFGKLSGTMGFNSHPSGADTRIRFCLAAIDPNGQPTTGVVRVLGTKPSYDFLNDNALIKNASIWDVNRYLNLWSVKIAGDSYIGYAQYPFLDSIPMPQPIPDVLPDGVVIDYRVFGDVPPGESGPFGSYNKGRTATHETGHYLGLIHIWGDGLSCSDNATDYCDDTPKQASYTSGCPTSVASCQTGVPAMFQNYLDYTNDACMNIFTYDQKRRMRIVMRNAPRRKTLFTTPTQCGVSAVSIIQKTILLEASPNPASDQIFIANADFSSTNSVVLFDASGKNWKVTSTKEATGIRIQTAALPSGLYWAEMSLTNGKVARAKFVKL